MDMTLEQCVDAGHKVEFVREKGGILFYYCVPCDKEHEQNQDCTAGC